MSSTAYITLISTIVGTVLAMSIVVIVIVHQKRLLAQERERTKAVLQAQEQEQARIAHELHDGLGIEVIAAKQMVRELSIASPQHIELDDRYKILQDTLEKIYQDQRRISHNLMPSSLERFGLIEALGELASRINETGKTTCAFSTTGDYTRSLAPDVELALYRIAQEGLHNAIKHAQATSFELKVAVDPHSVRMKIVDNGKGFDPDVAKKGLGLKSMTSRAALLGAVFHVHSEIGIGTQITLEIQL